MRNPQVESPTWASSGLTPMTIPGNKQKSRKAGAGKAAAELGRGKHPYLLKHSSIPGERATPRLCRSFQYLGLNELWNICFIRRAWVCFWGLKLCLFWAAGVSTSGACMVFTEDTGTSSVIWGPFPGTPLISSPRPAIAWLVQSPGEGRGYCGYRNVERSQRSLGNSFAWMTTVHRISDWGKCIKQGQDLGVPEESVLKTNWNQRTFIGLEGKVYRCVQMCWFSFHSISCQVWCS